MNLVSMLKDLDPEKFADEGYKKILPEEVYNWHKKMKHDKTWSDYIISVLISDYQCNNYGPHNPCCPIDECVGCILGCYDG